MLLLHDLKMGTKNKWSSFVTKDYSTALKLFTDGEDKSGL